MKKISENNIRVLTKNKRFSVLMLVLILMALIFISYSWHEALLETENEAKKVAQTAEAGISNTVISNLDLDDLENISEDRFYSELKNALKFIKDTDKDTTFSYVLLNRNNQILILADSEIYGSEDYSPPGDVYFEATEDDFRVFEEGKTITTKPNKDRWGTWKSVLVPITDSDGSVIAAFGVDYDVNSWYKYAVVQTIDAVVISIALLLLVIAIYFFMCKNEELEKEKQKLIDSDEKLKESETLFRSIFEQATIGISIGNSKKNVAALIEGRSTVNPMFQKILKRSENELMSINWDDITHPLELKKDIELFEKFQNKEIDGYDMEKRYLRPDGTYVWVHMIISPLDLENLEGRNHLCLIEDITKNKEKELKLKYMTEHNVLTGIQNRVCFEKILRSESNNIYDKKRAVILVNVEKFNLLNITYGYFYAENIIKLLGTELQKLS